MSIFSPLEVSGRRIGYARVSTDDQRLDMQLDALKRAKCDLLFKDHGISGARASRPGLDKALEALEAGDVLIVYRLDRLGRSVLNLADILNRFEDGNIFFCSLTEGINTTTSGGKLVFHMFSAMAEFQRNIIRENTIHGIRAARQRGKQIGRPYALNEDTIWEAQYLIETHQMSVAKVARKLAVPRTTLSRSLKRLNKEAA